jgi:hypothetical protein
MTLPLAGVMTPCYSGVMTPRPMSTEATAAFLAWSLAVEAKKRWRTDDEYDDLSRDEESAWEAWQEIAADEGRCQQCNADLELIDGWPYAYCYEHVADDQRKDWDDWKAGLE